jgi:hypothetical protein
LPFSPLQAVLFLRRHIRIRGLLYYNVPVGLGDVGVVFLDANYEVTETDVGIMAIFVENNEYAENVVVIAEIYKQTKALSFKSPKNTFNPVKSNPLNPPRFPKRFAVTCAKPVCKKGGL